LVTRLESLGLQSEQVDFVVNRSSRAEIVPKDVVRVFGREPLAILPMERTVPALQDRGRLLPMSGRVGRMFLRLAERIAAEKASAA
jgi:hypothetical protein